MFPYANKDKELPTAAKKGETEVFLAELEYLKTLAGQNKKFIYRAGRTPDWVVGGGDDSDEEGETRRERKASSSHGHGPDRPRGVMKIKLEKDHSETSRRIHKAQVLGKTQEEKETPVVASHKRSRAIELEEDDEQEVKKETPSKQQKQDQTPSVTPAPTPTEVTVIDTSKMEVQEDPATEEGDEELEDRRQRARERAKEQAVKEEKEAALKKEAGGLEGEDETMEDEEAQQKKMLDGLGEAPEGGEGMDEAAEESEESEDEAGDVMIGSRPLLKPVFVSKKERETIAERKRLEEEETALENAKKERVKERKTESQKMLIDEIKREDEANAKKQQTAGQQAGDSDEDMPDDADGGDEKKELEEWKLREMKRITRDKKEREAYEAERKEVARRRLLTDAEIERENLEKQKPKRPDKGTYRFLQKYYHPGAFFQDPENPIQQRDFTAPTGEDRTVDRTLLPKVLQVKKFGLKGRTKYTHLVDQDTSLVTGPPGMWAQLKAAQAGAATQQGGTVQMNLSTPAQTMTKDHTPGAAQTPIPAAPGAFRPTPSEWNPWGKSDTEADFIHKRRLAGMGPLDRRTRGGHSKKKVKDDD